LFAITRDAVRSRTGTARHDLRDLRSRIVDAHTIVGRDTLGEAALDQLAVARTAQLLAVVVRARTPGQEPEALHPVELRAERIGHTALEPADHPGARAAEDNALLPRLAQEPV